jgi:DNA-binding protein H-NS
MQMDLEKLSLDELKALQNEVAVEIFNFEKKKKAEILAELEALAHAKGFSLKELLGNPNGKSTKKSVVPKYADPENPENTWTGRGRKPKWFVTALENGCTAEDFAI